MKERLFKEIESTKSFIKEIDAAIENASFDFIRKIYIILKNRQEKKLIKLYNKIDGENNSS